MKAAARLRVRLHLALGAAEIHLRVRFPGLTAALTRRPRRGVVPFAELVRIESDPAYRTLFCAELDAAIAERYAVRTEEAQVAKEVEAAADRLRTLLRDPVADERAA
ncbi:hypothetical protein [Streptomyces sp. NPDC101181]|uniref:hypothetical protein n=1 Tax=Streptomyces sp. NPDC101181 TaxID=3366125 RepID=UPI0038131C20